MATITQKFLKEAKAQGVVVLTRRQWGTVHGATYLLRRRTHKHFLLPKRPSDTLWQHITVTRRTGNFRDDMRTVERIGWDRFRSGFSYNLGWDLATGKFGLGQSLDAKGTHTVNEKPDAAPGFSRDQNGMGLAIAGIGMVGDSPTTKAIEQLVRVHVALILSGALTTHYDYEPHSLVAFKDCPTDAIRAIMAYVTKEARSRANAILQERREGIPVGTINIRHGLSDEEATEDFKDMLSKDLEVFAVQEGGSRRLKEWSLLANEFGYRVVGPLVYKKKNWVLVNKGSHFLSSKVKVGSPGAGPSVMRGKRAAWITLKNRHTKEVESFINVHLMPSVYIPVRSRESAKQIKNLAELVRTLKWKGHVTAMGDLNIDHKKWRRLWRFRHLRLAGLKPNWKLGFKAGPTHGKRFIDAVWSTRNPRKHYVSIGFNSDHRPLSVIL